MGGEVQYKIAQNAYIKLVLHALKHRTSAVNAVLLAPSSAAAAGSAAAVEITEAVPLFHSQIGLLPPLEFALNMIEGYFESRGLNIVGYFHANERFDDLELGNVAKNIGDHIHRFFPDAAVLLLDNKKLEALSKGKGRTPVMQLYTRDAAKTWKQVVSDSSGGLSLKEPLANVVLSDYIASEKWKDIVDFDDHYDDISKDWLNTELFK